MTDLSPLHTPAQPSVVAVELAPPPPRPPAPAREVDLEDIFQDASGEISGRLTTLWNRLVAVRAAFPAKLKKKREATIPMNLINKKRRIEKKRNQSAARIQRTALKYVYTPRPGRAAPCATKALEF